MIKVGIIDRDEQTRSEIKKILVENCMSDETIHITILFDAENCSVLPDRTTEVPDVLLLDIDDQEVMIIERVRKKYPQTEIIILTHRSDVKTVRKSLRNGAVSYLLKDTCMEELMRAILVTFNQGSVISPSINRALINQFFNAKKYEDLLTARELQIANGIVEGLSYKLIADQYKISLDTVRIYIKRVYRKLNVNSKGELIAQFSA